MTILDDIRLYRDDVLILLTELNEQQIKKTKKNIKVFKAIVFQIEIEINLYEVNFLDITFNLRHTNQDIFSLQEAKWQSIVCTYFTKLPSSNNQAASNFHQRMIIHQFFLWNRIMKLYIETYLNRLS